MAKDNYEKHVEDLIKVRSEIRKAAKSYVNKNYADEAYHMCRAIAMADALSIDNDEFFLHKRLVEKEFEMQDCLIMDDFFSYHKDVNVYSVLYIDSYDCAYGEKVFRDKDSAERHYKEFVQKFFNLDKLTADSWGKSFKECLEDGEAFFEDNENHGEIYISLRSYKLR